MGQYHVLVNLDKKEVVTPHGLGLGLKQWEHIGTEGSLPDAMYVLTMTSPARGGGDLPETGISGRWAGDRVLIVGDYTEDSDLPSYPNFGKVYGESDNWNDITDFVADAFKTIFNLNITGDGWKRREKVSA